MYSLIVGLHSPVQWVVLHAEVVAREVTCRVAQVVKLVPEDPAMTWRGGNYCHFDRQVDLRLHCLTTHTGGLSVYVGLSNTVNICSISILRPNTFLFLHIHVYNVSCVQPLSMWECGG